MKMRLALMVAVTGLDLGTKWAMYDSSMLNPGLARADGWLLGAGFVACAVIYAALAFGVVVIGGATGVGLALWLGGSLGQAIQFVVTGSVSDWIPVGPFGRLTIWTNLADIAAVVGATICTVQWGWYGPSHESYNRRYFVKPL